MITSTQLEYLDECETQDINQQQQTTEAKMNNSNNAGFNTAFNKFVQAGASGSGRNNPDSKNYVGPRNKNNITADNKIIGQS